jgi:hypothetical protein
MNKDKKMADQEKIELLEERIKREELKKKLFEYQEGRNE